jgi:hypothetical protein
MSTLTGPQERVLQSRVKDVKVEIDVVRDSFNALINTPYMSPWRPKRFHEVTKWVEEDVCNLLKEVRSLRSLLEATGWKEVESEVHKAD